MTSENEYNITTIIEKTEEKMRTCKLSELRPAGIQQHEFLTFSSANCFFLQLNDERTRSVI